ncbi:MAG: 6-bladed beta-propeller [Candidatus Aminicenantes bacterium]|nr:6-bladed beta-propeller [Candidatus Aminicenantes bacterium]
MILIYPIIKPQKKLGSVFFIPLLIFLWLFSAEKNQLKEVKIKGKEDIFFSQPIDIETDGSRIYILDSRECSIRVFSFEGQQLAKIGRYGRGPGEFTGSSDLDINGDEIALLDSEGHRVIFYGVDGSYRGEFKLGFRGHRISSLSKDKIIVSYLPRMKEKNVFCLKFFNREGKKLAEAEKVSSSGHGAYDFFLFQHYLIKRGYQLLLVKPFGPQLAIVFDETGKRLGEIKAQRDHPIIQFTPPLSQAKKIQALFWSATIADDKIYLIIPGRMKDGDLGPSPKVAILNSQDKLEGFIQFPLPVYKLTKIGQRFFVIDELAQLRLFDLIDQ